MNLQGEIRRQKKGDGGGEFDGLIIGRSQSQQEIDAQIDRLADEFRKKESPAGTHELERDGAKKTNSAGLGEIWQEGEHLDHLSTPQVAGETRMKRGTAP